jgi:hypothetical protein
LSRTALVVTSISPVTAALEALAVSAERHDVDFIVIGDVSSPLDFELDGCDFYGVAKQKQLGFELASVSPQGHYARKNIGYLLAMERRASVIVETDDDTVADDEFWRARIRTQAVPLVTSEGWTNAYRFFTESQIWPRGFPLEHATAAPPARDHLPVCVLDCPIQQGLIDDDPDVDAIYRMLFRLPFRFDRGAPVALGAGAWCPLNSQNTSWWPDAFPLLYLPATCSFRMTDIWRGFVAQRIAWANGWNVVFHEATVRQARNGHDLSHDFVQEVPGYVENRGICAALSSLELRAGPEQIAENLRCAYEALVAGGWLDPSELRLLDAWLTDVEALAPRPAAEAVP